MLNIVDRKEPILWKAFCLDEGSYKKRRETAKKKLKNISGEMDSRIDFKMFKNLRVPLPPPGKKFWIFSPHRERDRSDILKVLVLLLTLGSYRFLSWIEHLHRKAEYIAKRLTSCSSVHV